MIFYISHSTSILGCDLLSNHIFKYTSQERNYIVTHTYKCLQLNKVPGISITFYDIVAWVLNVIFCVATLDTVEFYHISG